jgi:hypothetical protein
MIPRLASDGKSFEGKSRKQVQWRGFCGILIHAMSPCFRDYGQDYLLYLYYKELFIVFTGYCCKIERFWRFSAIIGC